MKYDYIYDTSTQNTEQEYELNREGDCLAKILLKEQNFALEINSQGKVVLYDIDGKVIDTKKIKSEKYPDKKFSDVIIKISNDKIQLNMLMKKYVDHYPHCDGEYDRWSVIHTENIPVTFEIK